MKWIYASLLLLVTRTIAQDEMVFKGQLLHLRGEPLKQTAALINNQLYVVTDDFGFFQVSLPRASTRISVTLPHSPFRVIVPFAGYVPLPKDPNIRMQVVTGVLTDHPYMREYVRLHQTKQNVSDSLILARSQLRMDSLRIRLIRFNYSERELTGVLETMEEQARWLPLLMNDLIYYRDKAAALAFAFRFLSPYAFDNTNALDSLLEAVRQYNQAYGQIDSLHLREHRHISRHWPESGVSRDYETFASYVIHQVHGEQLHPIQEIILQIRQYAGSRKKNAETRKFIEQNTARVNDNLRSLWPEFDRRMLQLLGRLEKSGYTGGLSSSFSLTSGNSAATSMINAAVISR